MQWKKDKRKVKEQVAKDTKGNNKLWCISQIWNLQDS